MTVSEEQYKYASFCLTIAIEGELDGLNIGMKKARKIVDFVLTETFGRAPASGNVITAKQVEAACAQHWSGTWYSDFHSEYTKNDMRKMMRKTLESAFTELCGMPVVIDDRLKGNELKIVKSELTPAMINAYCETMNAHGIDKFVNARIVWDAMMDAAPSVSTPQDVSLLVKELSAARGRNSF